MNQTDLASTDTDRYHVPNLERALVILEYLARHNEGCGISEMAEALELPKNSVFRIVSTLHAYDYLTRDEDSKRFSLSGKLLTLGYAAVREGHLVEKSIDIMRWVRDQANETVLVGILDNAEGVVLENVTSNGQLQVVVKVGTRFPLHTAAPGKAIMAYLPEDELHPLLDKIEYPRYTDRTVTSKKAMLVELESVRRLGYGIDNGEHNEGIRCVGAPIFNQRRYPVGAIWITGPSFRISSEDFPRLGGVLKTGADRISRRFGYGG